MIVSLENEFFIEHGRLFGNDLPWDVYLIY